MKPIKKMMKRLSRRQAAMAVTIANAKYPTAYKMPGSLKK